MADIIDRMALKKRDWATSRARLKGLPRTVWSTAIAHFGVGVTVIGVVCATAFQTEIVTSMRAGESIPIGGYVVHYDGEEWFDGPNFDAERGQFRITSPWGGERTITSERRFYPVSGTPTTEAGIRTYGFSQMYVQFGERFASDARVVRLWHKPMVILIWLGTVFMAAAGFLSLSDRRIRIGAPTKARSGKKLAEGTA